MLDSPHDIAVDSSGNVYVAEQGNFRIQKFDSQGNFITSWGSAGSWILTVWLYIVINN